MSDIKRWWWLGAIVLLGWLVVALSPILSPFLLGAILAYLGDPVADWLETKKIPRTWAVVIVFTLFSLVGLLLLLMMIPLLKQQADLFSSKSAVVSGWFETQAKPWLVSTFDLPQGQLDFESLHDAFGEQIGGASGIVASLFKSLTSSGMALFGWLGNLVLVPVVTFYLLRDWDDLVARIRSLLPRHMEPVVVQLGDECDTVLSAFVRGQLMVMMALGLIYSIGLWMVGLDVALLAGFIAGLASIVPYLGFIIGILFASIAALIQFGDASILLFVAIVFIVGQMLEGMVLTPLLVGDKIGLHPVAVIFAILAGGQLFGFTGVLLALPVAAVIMVLLRHAHDKYLGSVLYGATVPLSSGEEIKEPEPEVVTNPIKEE
ncbi:AI-2E family transporter [Pleionea sp. CnH1-48]|uniref:AI-2E family transporter n=1 Tax=Pleionea sp. CnH1-48 TaxID=2954494 RepID=UPI0020970544|nr:AI-2E family transporter [Pleionea sp. CnH1-48]MCO7222901.1 AI-2E family transporter [Pleionea sp. CnH1-48]